MTVLINFLLKNAHIIMIIILQLPKHFHMYYLNFKTTIGVWTQFTDENSKAQTGTLPMYKSYIPKLVEFTVEPGSSHLNSSPSAW